MTAPRFMYAAARRLGYPIITPKLREVVGVEHLPTQGGYILAANHIDWLDGFYIAVAVGQARSVPVYFLSTTNNYWWTTLTLKIPRERSAIIEQASDYLRQGKVICNFPEGQRNPDRQLRPGKNGTVRLALAAGVPVIPVGIACDYGRTMGQSVQYLFSRRHPVTLRFGEPMRFTARPHEADDDYLQDSTERIMKSIAPLANKLF